MAVYSPEQLGVKPPSGGFQTGGWYEGRQYWNGTLSEPGVIHPSSNQQGAGQAVSPEVNALSAAQQGVSPQQLESYLQQQRDKSQGIQGQEIAPAPGAGTPGAGTPTGYAGAMPQISTPETINLPELYKSLIASSGIKELETKLSGMEKDYIEAKAEINDNPFLSEATRVGRIAKLESLFQERTANLRGDIATKKADIETQLNLESRQFDINSQVAKQALDQFNTLLSMGALDNASGEDIAGLTRATGLSSEMIYSAIQANKAKNVSTSTISYDDGTNQGFAIINDKTGEIISKQVIAASKPKAASVTQQKEEDEQAIRRDLEAEAQRGATWDALYRLGLGFLDPNDIYQIYLAYGRYSPSEEQQYEDLKRYRLVE